MATIFDELLGIGDPEDWERMRHVNKACEYCTCCREVQCTGEDEAQACDGCPCTSR